MLVIGYVAPLPGAATKEACSWRCLNIGDSDP